MAAIGGSAAPPLGSLLEGTSGGTLPPLPPKPPESSKASIASGAGEELPGEVGDVSSIFEEIEAQGLTPVTQGKNDPLPAGLALGDFTPPSPPHDHCSHSHFWGAPGLFHLSVVHTSLKAAKPIEATAHAMWPGPESPGAPLAVAGQPTSFLGGDPTANSPSIDAMAAAPTMEKEPGITEGPIPIPLTPESSREMTPWVAWLLGLMVPFPLLSLTPLLIPAPTPDADPVPLHLSSCCCPWG